MTTVGSLAVTTVVITMRMDTNSRDVKSAKNDTGEDNE